ncbi:MAG: lipoyl synthase [Gammaproteobacteria bacterium]|nr:lipoyl synthase [Gammaproteobacteria bacterium]
MTELPVFDFSDESNCGRMPEWIRQAFGSQDYAHTTRTLTQYALNTVCVEARCPNRGECWSRGTATFMLLGDTCTRACGFCAVKTGKPGGLDLDEPRRVAEAVKAMGLDYVVLTSVNRDDLLDGGAQIFADTLIALRDDNPQIKLELLTPDFHRSQQHALELMFHTLQELPGEHFLVWGHNVETVPRLYKRVRKGSDYQRSLDLLAGAAAHHGIETKSALMLGLGETAAEVETVLQDLARAGVKRVALGQYLRPTRYHLPVVEYISPGQFAEYETMANELGFRWVKAGAMVRSSYHAED